MTLTEVESGQTGEHPGRCEFTGSFMQRANIRMLCLTAERWTEGPQSWRTTNFLGHLERERVGVYQRAEADEDTAWLGLWRTGTPPTGPLLHLRKTRRKDEKEDVPPDWHVDVLLLVVCRNKGPVVNITGDLKENGELFSLIP